MSGAPSCRENRSQHDKDLPTDFSGELWGETKFFVVWMKTAIRFISPYRFAHHRLRGNRRFTGEMEMVAVMVVETDLMDVSQSPNRCNGFRAVASLITLLCF